MALDIYLLYTELSLHLLIQILSFFLVFEVRNKLLDGLHYLRFSKVVFVEDSFKIIEESIYLIHIMASGLFYDSKGLETLHVNLLAWHVELLVGFLTGGIRSKVHDGVLWK